MAKIRFRAEHFSVWIRRFGVAGFLFFLIKGIAWLAIGAFVAMRLG